MGASQSTGGAAEEQVGAVVKTSYYELLSVERTATQDEYDLISVTEEVC